MCATLALPFYEVFDLSPTGLRPFRLDIGERVIHLKRRPDAYCRFLADYSGEKRCGVYSVRPSTCRVYPFTVDVDNAQHKPFVMHCPVPFGVTKERRKQAESDALQAVADWKQHDDVRAKWKRSRAKDRSLEGFLKFALKHLVQDPGARKGAFIQLTERRSQERRLIDLMKQKGVLRITDEL